MDNPKIQNLNRGPYRTKYNNDDLTDAYNAVLERDLPVQRAAKMYGVPITTLKDRVRGRVDVDVVKSGPSPLFSQEQETLLANHLSTMAEIGYGYSRNETVKLASDFACHLGLREKGSPLTLKWLYNFLDRWPDLKVRKPRSLEAARAKSATKSVISTYFKELDRILTFHGLKDRPNAIFNVDEKGVSTDHKPPKVVSSTACKPQAVTSGKGKTVTIIGGGNAAGCQIPPFFVFPGKRMLDDLLAGATPGAAGTVSESGWSNTDIFSKYVKEHLFKYLPERSADSPVLVMYDGHRSHISIGLIEWAKQNHIILFVLPPHCSHLLQPMDVSCYGPFEIAWNSACHTYLRESGGNVITKYDVCRIACKSYTTTLTPANIQAAFKKCGIFPFDANVIPDSLVAPSLSFHRHVSISQPDATTANDNLQLTNIENTCTPISAELFLESRGGDILKNVKVAKVRNTLSKVVAGKPITDDGIIEKIKHHIASQGPKSTSRKRPINSPKPAAKPSSPLPSTSGIKLPCPPKHTLIESDSSSDSDVPEEEKCIVCKRFSPKDLQKLSYIKIIKWGQCDNCGGWVHLHFCTKVSVIRRGANFFCPQCDQNINQQ